MAVQHILMPSEAVGHVCHEEQMRVWTHEVVASLGMAGYIRDDIDTDGMIGIHLLIEKELRDILRQAFDHPEARTLACPGNPVAR